MILPDQGEATIKSDALVPSPKTIIRAEELAFPPNWDRDVFDTKVQLCIESLVDQFKCTVDEIAAFIVEHFDGITEEEVRRGVLRQVAKGLFTIAETLPNILTWPGRESVFSRDESIRWMRQNTVLSDVFSKNRQIYNNTIVDLRRKDRLHYHQIFVPTDDAKMVALGNQKGLMFSSNDYLGLSRHPDVVSAAKFAADRYGVGGTGSRISVGTMDVHVELERQLARFKHKDDCVVLSSGFLTNLTVFSMLDSDSVVFFDSLSHASMIAGIRFAGVRAIRFRHNDVDDLRKKIRQVRPESKMIVAVESIYSLDGDISPLPEILQIVQEWGAYLLVDEAHSTGTLGATGRGISEYFGLTDDQIDFKVGTLSKALASEGGFVCAKRRLIECLRYSPGPFMFTTSRSPVVVAGAAAALNVISSNSDLAARLQVKASKFRERLHQFGFDTGTSCSQIVPIMVGDTDIALDLQRYLQLDGLYVVAAIYPTVPPKKARIRVNVSLDHTDEQLDYFIKRLVAHSEKLKVI